eukprot:6492228-Amphidinium_carterae.1
MQASEYHTQIPKFSDPRRMRECHEKDFEKKSWFLEGVRVLKLWVFQSSSPRVGKVEEKSILSLHLLSVFHGLFEIDS